MLTEIMAFLGLDLVPATMGEFMYFFFSCLFGFAFFKLFLGFLWSLPKAFGVGGKSI